MPDDYSPSSEDIKAAYRGFEIGGDGRSPDSGAEGGRVSAYWNGRAAGFGEVRRFELESDKRELWLAEIVPLLPEAGRPLKILDIGTGTGFFSILMAQLGHDATGIDLSPAMVEEARKAAAKFGVAAKFLQMNALELEFGDETFDAVLTRNLTWTLPDVRAAYREWTRVLRPGGVLVNFDADYGYVSFSGVTSGLGAEGVRNAHEELGQKVLDECDAIKRELSISWVPRPVWDESVLRELGYREVDSDTALSERIYRVKDAAWNPIPMFRLSGRKPPRG